MSAQAPKPLPPEVIVALQSGKLIEAIRLLRASGNFDLKQAKEAIAKHLDRSKVAKATVGEAIGSLFKVPGVTEALAKGNKIEAIRLLREKTGLGLKEAKDAIDRFPDNATDHPNSRMSEPMTSTQPDKPQQTLSRRGLAPGEVPFSEGGSGRWLVVALIIVGALAYYFYTQ